MTPDYRNTWDATTLSGDGGSSTSSGVQNAPIDPIPLPGGNQEPGDSQFTLRGKSARPRKPIPVDPDVQPGFCIGEYEIISIIGHGAMGAVYGARDGTGHEVALKLFREDIGHSRTLIERFRREAEAVKKVRRHPYILTVYGSGREGPYHYIAMELIPGGKTLEAVINENVLDHSGWLRMTAKIASALHYAHEYGIIHRDVKPANIMVDEFGEPLLTDFGVAELQEWPGFTADGVLTGTPLYMSPEQASGNPLDGRSDVYALGVVLYEGLLRRYPYDLPADIRAQSVLEAVRHQRVVRPRRVEGSLPRDIEHVLLRSLAKEPSDRYRSARAFEDELLAVAEGRPIPARFRPPVTALLAKLKRYRLLIGILSAVLLLGLLGWSRVMAEVQEMREEELLRHAFLRNAELMIDRGLPLQFYQQGQRSMALGEWLAATDHFRTSETLALREGPARIVALARVGLARCEQILGNLPQAVELYDKVLGAPDSTPSANSMALLDMMIIGIEQGELTWMRNWFARRKERIGVGPRASLAAYIAGYLDEESFRKDMAIAPPSFANDEVIALALREEALGRFERCRALLESAAAKPIRPLEWPEPLRQRCQQRIDARQEIPPP